ncbi:recombinase family protein [uncultured Dysosmobacter sp.]|uniref:recombinase family protein n=1 Tax=uncultured Dysosmobacter sp. TaxID=2591384 RepID=UPI00262BE3FC|nr:recombinase family protein [uncultured Dysosmobacter sp.]
MMQNLNTAMEAPRITVIDPRVLEKQKLRVAAYARVSSDSKDQINSYLAQVDFYTKYISSREDWIMVDIYADEGLSGLETQKRDDFNRMLEDCRAGKIDRILVKSISRFARNTKEYIQYMRELLRLGISIYFEKENIDTGKLTTEQAAQIYGAFAQMESTNHSSTMRHSNRMRMQKGIFTPPTAPYGYRLVERELEIVKEEADIVQYIFRTYLNGQGIDDISNELNDLGAIRGHGRERWHPSTVSYILTNISYTGNMIWQKSYATDTVPFRQVRNTGQKAQYFVENTHPAIVSMDEFEKVKTLMAFRKEQFLSNAQPRPSIYSKHIFCAVCGSVCRRKVTKGKIYWVCRKHDQSKSRCPVPQIPESEITAAVLRLSGKLIKNRDQILGAMLERLRELQERELRSNRKISDIDHELAHLSEQNLVLVRLKSKGYVDPALYLSQQDEIIRKQKDLRKLRRNILETMGGNQQIQATETMLDYLEGASPWKKTVDGEIFEALIERIQVISAEEAKIRLLNELELTECMERTVR